MTRRIERFLLGLLLKLFKEDPSHKEFKRCPCCGQEMRE